MEILPPLWKDIGAEGRKHFKGLAADAVEDLMERLADDKIVVDIGDVPKLLRDTAHRIETLLGMIGNNHGKG